MAECPFCRGVLEQADLEVGKCLVCGKKLPQGIVIAPPIDDSNSSTHDEQRLAATRNLGPLPPDAVGQAQTPGAATHDQRIAATVDAGQLLGDDAGPLAPLWAGKFDRGADPRASIGRSGSESGDGPDLVIQPRILCDSNAAARALADYELLGQIGKGGMGVVLAARQASVARTVALKKLNPALANDPESRRKFLAEAVVTGDLEHPNIVPIYDLGKDESGLLFYSMKRVKGTPWDQVIAQKSLAENVEILMKVADAVAFAHSRGVVHRDLKPENVMLGGYGEVLLMDWGLAIKPNSPAAKAAGMGGTPAYMAPEMIFTRPEQIGFSADIYLLGAILYEIVTGSPPHEGGTVSACLNAAAKNHIRPTDKTDELVSIALKAMATAPADRYPAVGDFQEAIRQYWSHSQSVLLSDRAAADLQAAAEREDYDRYARALLGFQEAFELWQGNTRAKAGIAATSYAYARRALSKGNFDLAASLLDEANAEHVPLLREIRAAQKEQDARQQRLKTAKRIGAALVATILVVVSVAFFLVSQEKRKAEDQRKIAVQQKDEADKAKDAAVEAQKQEEAAKNAALEAERQEKAAKEKEETAKNAAVELQKQAIIAKNNADKAKDDAVEAQRQEKAAKEKEENGAYVARIGLASAKIDDNAFGMARALLDDCPRRLRNWEWGRLKYLCGLSDRTIAVPEPIEALALSPDGRRFVTGGLGGTAQLWDMATGQAIALPTGGQYVFAAAFSPDGKHVALGTNHPPAYLKIYAAAGGRLEREFTSHKTGDGRIVGHEDAVLSVAYSPDGKRLLTSSYDNTARLWDPESGDEIRVFRGHDWWVWSAEFSSDGEWIITASQDGSAIVWDVQSGQPRATFRGHTGPVYRAVFAPDGGKPSMPVRGPRVGRREPMVVVGEKPLPHLLVASGGYDKRVLLWWPDKVRDFDFGALGRPADSDADSGDGRLSAQSAVLLGHTAAIRAIAFSDDGQLLATGSDDNTVRVWNVAARQLVKTLRGHGGRVRAVAFTAGGKGEERRLFSGGHDQKVMIWDLHRYEEMRIIEARGGAGSREPILGAAYSPNGEQIVTACRNRTARLWDREGNFLREFRQGHQYLVSTAVFYPDRRRLLTAAMDGTARVWDLATEGQVRVLRETGAGAAVALSHNGKWIASGGDSQPAAAESAAGPGPVIDAGQAPDGEAGPLWPVRLWDADTGDKPLRTFSAHRSEVTAVAFSPDDQLLFSGDANGCGQLWDIKASSPAGPLQKIHVRGITAAAFLPRGGGLLTASGDNSVVQWDLVAGPKGYSFAPRQVLRHPDAVSSLAVSPDGTCAVTTCADKVVRFWDLPRGEPTAMILAGRDHHPTLLDARAAGDILAWREAELSKLRQEKRELSVAPQGRLSDDAKRKTDLAIQHVADMEQLVTGDEKINSAAFSPDGVLAVTTSTDGKVRLWDWRAGAKSVPARPARSRRSDRAAARPGPRSSRPTASASPRLAAATPGSGAGATASRRCAWGLKGRLPQPTSHPAAAAWSPQAGTMRRGSGTPARLSRSACCWGTPATSTTPYSRSTAPAC